jgi:hypothetical protein
MLKNKTVILWHLIKINRSSIVLNKKFPHTDVCIRGPTKATLCGKRSSNKAYKKRTLKSVLFECSTVCCDVVEMRRIRDATSR